MKKHARNTFSRVFRRRDCSCYVLVSVGHQIEEYVSVLFLRQSAKNFHTNEFGGISYRNKLQGSYTLSRFVGTRPYRTVAYRKIVVIPQVRADRRLADCVVHASLI